MFGGLIIFVPFHIVRDLFCRDFAIIGGEGDDLVSRGFNGAGFVAIDVAAEEPMPRSWGILLLKVKVKPKLGVANLANRLMINWRIPS